MRKRTGIRHAAYTVNKFIELGKPCMEVSYLACRSAKTVTECLRLEIKKLRNVHVIVVQRGKHVYLINIDLMEYVEIGALV